MIMPGVRYFLNWGEMSDAVIARKVADELTWRTMRVYL